MKGRIMKPQLQKTLIKKLNEIGECKPESFSFLKSGENFNLSVSKFGNNWSVFNYNIEFYYFYGKNIGFRNMFNQKTLKETIKIIDLLIEKYPDIKLEKK